MKPYPPLRLLIDGEWLPADGRQTLPVLNPATEEVLGQMPVATPADLDRAIAAAARGHQAWSALSAHARAKILVKTANLLRERTQDIAELMTLEQGKPLGEALGEARNLPDILEWDAAEGQRLYGRIIPSRVAGQRQLVVKEPIGPVAVFTPWNYPALIPVRKISSVLAAGCACIIKPAEETPAIAMAVVQAFVDAGVPPGVLNLVCGVPADISSHLIASLEIEGIAFTGSTAVRRELCAQATRSFKRMVMELGGHAPVIVFDDVDVPKVAEMAALRKYRNSGQGCVNPSRYYVHDSIFEAFTSRFTEVVQGFKVGPGFDPATNMGPLAHERRIPAMDHIIADALAHGATLRCGGKRQGDKGYFWLPAVLTDVPNEAHIMQEEPFGPIVVINRFSDVEDAFAQANRLRYGLAAYAFTESGARQHLAASRLNAGMIGINTYALGAPDSIGSPEPPFGGVKDSGYGLEGGSEGLEAFQSTKFISQF